MNHVFRFVCAVLFGAMAFPVLASTELSSADVKPAPAAPGIKNCGIGGTAMDTNGGELPSADVLLDGPDAVTLRNGKTDNNGYFVFEGLQCGGLYLVHVSSDGFEPWASEVLTLKSGQFLNLTGIQLKLPTAVSSVTVYARNDELAVQQVQVALDQRVLGFIPNFFVVYDSQNAVPLPAKQKFRLALRVTTDPMAFAGAGFLAGVSQAARTPGYPLGAKGYAQRFGATYADNTIDILFGGAILPSLFHQDPRYYYQGMGSTRSRIWHAVQYPFACMGDSGRLQPNYSTIGGDVVAAAASNLYYPKQDRGAQLILTNLLVGTAERMASTLAQEFLLRRFTSRARRN